MKEKELEAELFSLGKGFKEDVPSSLIPSTLKILEERGRRTPLFLRVGPVLSTFLVFLILMSFFSFTAEPLLNLTKVVSLIFSFIIGTLFIFNPEKMSRIDKRLIGSLSHKGIIATPLQERIIFRIQGIYFILIAFFICKL